jgi:hypothetical protein
MFAHRLQEVVHFSQQTQRVIYWRCDFSEAFNESFLSDDAGFLLRYVSDAHLKFCLACSHGAPWRLRIPICLLGAPGYPTRPARRMLGMSDDIINQASQVRRLAVGEFYGLWHGQGIYLPGGRMRLFNTRKAAWAFLAHCDSAGCVIRPATVYLKAL